MDDPICARCGDEVSVDPELEWNDGDVCWRCSPAHIAGLEAKPATADEQIGIESERATNAAMHCKTAGGRAEKAYVILHDLADEHCEGGSGNDKGKPDCCYPCDARRFVRGDAPVPDYLAIVTEERDTSRAENETLGAELVELRERDKERKGVIDEALCSEVGRLKTKLAECRRERDAAQGGWNESEDDIEKERDETRAALTTTPGPQPCICPIIRDVDCPACNAELAALLEEQPTEGGGCDTISGGLVKGEPCPESCDICFDGEEARAMSEQRCPGCDLPSWGEEEWHGPCEVSWEKGWTKGRLRGRGEGWRAAIEAAAGCLEDEVDHVKYTFGGSVYDDGPRTIQACVSAIRNLKPPEGK